MFLGSGITVLEQRPALTLGCVIAISVAGPIARFAWPVVGRMLAARNWALPAVATASAILVAGVVGALTVRAWWSPYHPADPSIIARYISMNGAILHFDARSLSEHFLRHLLYGSSIVLVALPTVLVAGLVVSIFALRRVPKNVSWIFAFMVAFALVQLVAAAALNVPIANRYVNISIGGMGLMMALLCVVLFANLRPMMAACGYALVAFALLAELAPFRPLLAAFRPFWLEYPSPTIAEPGGLNPSWVG